MARKLSRAVLDRHDYWKQQIHRWRHSGLSQAEFCRQHGLAEQQFSKWKTKLGTSRPPVKKQNSNASHIPPGPDRFVEVKLPDAVEPSYLITLANGRTLQIGHSYDARIVSELIAIMEQSC